MTSPTLRTLKFATLEVFAREPKRSKNKMNLVGRPGQAGELEQQLDCIFDPSTRQQAYRAIEQLQHDGLLTPTFADIVAPEAWLIITERGHTALNRKVLDTLDEALLGIDPHLVEIRAGGWSAIASAEPDALRQAAHSARELIEQVLKISSPDELVKQQAWYKPDSSSRSGVTRRHRLKFLVERGRSRYSQGDLHIAEKVCDLVQAIDAKLQALSHSRTTPQRSDVEDALLSAEIALRRLLIPSNE